MTTRLRSGGNEQICRRRFRKRRPKGTLLVCSDSDSDQEKMITNDSSNKKFSDSDCDDMEFFAQQRYSLSRFPAVSAPLLVESDSVTDCLPPNHPPRRRRMLKKMNVEDIKLEVENSFLKRAEVLRKDLKCKWKFPDPTPVRKRKRSIWESRTFLETNEATSSSNTKPVVIEWSSSGLCEQDQKEEIVQFYLWMVHNILYMLRWMASSGFVSIFMKTFISSEITVAVEVCRKLLRFLPSDSLETFQDTVNNLDGVSIRVLSLTCYIEISKISSKFVRHKISLNVYLLILLSVGTLLLSFSDLSRTKHVDSRALELEACDTNKDMCF